MTMRHLCNLMPFYVCRAKSLITEIISFIPAHFYFLNNTRSATINTRLNGPKIPPPRKSIALGEFLGELSVSRLAACVELYHLVIR